MTRRGSILTPSGAAAWEEVGPHAERPVFDRLLGSVAEGVARRSPCPVLVARRSAAPDPPDADRVDVRSYRPEDA